MNKRQLGLIALISSLFTLTVMAGSLLFFLRVSAAPPVTTNLSKAAQTPAGRLQYVSLSSLAFRPVTPLAVYNLDFNQQLLTLGNQTRNFSGDVNRFVGMLTLPDQARLTGLTIFGQDFDNLGEVRLRLKRCDHNQPRCIILTETTSTVEYDAGPFEKVSLFNELVDNGFYTYFLELELTALGNSGLRSVRLELAAETGGVPSSGSPEQWSLSGEVRSFRLPNQITTQARVCTDDLSYLDNATHYPVLIVDGQSIPLASNTCVTVYGFNMELRRELNTGPSSGTYQFLR
ncbi:MAG TPA: hypothetical protein VEC96_15875 [Anaerolineae bacterium]|nr:hypothetical protein [Anaerolineae bacterium]HXV98966.1 hypothetical protein [Anaerolineae bacterium]